VTGNALETLSRLFMGDLRAQLRVISPTLGPKTQEESQKYFYITYFFKFQNKNLAKVEGIQFGIFSG